jgi:carbamoyltransferase
VPPVPGDAGVAVGAAYHFACLGGAKPGESLQHAFYCGIPPARNEIEDALAKTPEIAHRHVGNISTKPERDRLADLLAFIISSNGVVGIYQGAAETGPRALGHRSILANPTNPKTLETLNKLVKFRELIRPLAPMATLEAAKKWFNLSPGAGDDDFNAYNYMVLTSRAKPEAYGVIPAVIHFDGTCRVQIVREHTDPFVHAYLKAMGRRVGAEVSVNTSLNVGAPIAQTPVQALETLKKSKGMHALFMIAASGELYVVWHNVESAPKDGGKTLLGWLDGWTAGAGSGKGIAP